MVRQVLSQTNKRMGRVEWGGSEVEGDWNAKGAEGLEDGFAEFTDWRVGAPSNGIRCEQSSRAEHGRCEKTWQNLEHCKFSDVSIENATAVGVRRGTVGVRREGLKLKRATGDGMGLR
jgi:hypothetical protein